MADINQRATSTLIINGEQAKAELAAIEKEVTAVTQKIAAAKKAGNDALAAQLRKQKAELTTASRELRKEVVNVNNTLNNLSAAKPKELSATIRVLQNQLKDPSVKRGSEEWRRYTEQIRLCRAELGRVNAELNIGKSTWGRAADGFNRFGASAMSIIAGISGVAFTIKSTIKEFAKLTDSYADVMKYTGMTREEVEDLNEAFEKIDTRTTRERLNELAGDAGRLGLQTKEAILEFVEAADIINVALGEDLGENAVKNIAKLSNLFGATESMGLKEGMLSVGSAINEVAQNSSAAERYLLEFTARLAGAGKQAGVSMTNILGYASVLDQDMQKLEMSATAVQKVLLKMFQDTGTFAKMAGKDVGEFTELLKTDANEAFLQLLTNLQRQGGLEQLAPLFKDMQLDGVRAVGVLSNLATSVDRVRAEQERATSAYEAGTSVIDEFNVRNTNEQALLEKKRKIFKEIVYEIGERLLPHYTSLLSGTSNLLRAILTLIDALGKHKGAIISTGTAIVALTVQQKGLAFWNDKVIGSIKTLFAVIKANPIAAATLGLSVLAGVLYDVYRRSKEAVTYMDRLTEKTNDLTRESNFLFDALKKTTEGTVERKKAIDQINTVYGDYAGYLLDEKASLQDILKYQELVNKSLLKNAAIRAQKEELESVGEDTTATIRDAYSRLLKNVTASRDLTPQMSAVVARDLHNIIAEMQKNTEGATGEAAFRQDNQTIKYSAADMQRDFNTIRNAIRASNRQMSNIKGFYQAYIDNLGGAIPDVAADGSLTIAEGETTTPPKGDETTDKERKAALQKALKDLEEHYAEQRTLTKQQLLDKTLTESEANKELERLDLESMKARIDILTKFGESTAAIDEQAVDKQIAANKKADDAQKKAKEGQLKDDLKMLDDAQSVRRLLVRAGQTQMTEEQKKGNYELEMLELQSLEERLDLLRQYGEDVLLLERQILEKRVSLAEKMQADTDKNPRYGSLKEKYNAEQAALEERYADGLIVEEEYRKQKKELKKAYLEMELADEMEFADMASQIAEQSLQAISNFQDAALLKVESRYDKELLAAKGNRKKTAEIEKKMEEEKNKVRKKYAGIDFAMNVAKIVSDTAVGMMRLWTSPGFPAAIPLMGVLGALSISQIAVANQQRKKVMNMWTGGYTGPGQWNEPKGYVHSNEFVGNRFAVANPAINRVFSVVDRAQQSNAVASITGSDIINALGGAQATPGNVVVTSTTDPLLVETLALVSASIASLDSRLTQGTLARTYLLGEGGVNTTQDKLTTLTNNGRRNRV